MSSSCTSCACLADVVGGGRFRQEEINEELICKNVTL